MDTKIAIIGAGIAGMKIASLLQSKGYENIKIFEAMNRIGGRIETQFYTDHNGSPYKLEFGAEWVLGINGNPVHKLALEHNLYKPFAMPFEASLAPRDCTVENEDILKLCTYQPISQIENAQLEQIFTDTLDYVVELSEKKDADALKQYPSAGHCLHAYMESRINKLSEEKQILYNIILEQKLNAMNTYKACNDFKEVSFESYAGYLDFDGQEPKINEGTIRLVEALGKYIPNEKISFGDPVDKIKYDLMSNESKDSVRVETKSGISESFDCVVVTFSVAVLQNCHQFLFDPPLPAYKVDSFQHIQLGIVDRIYLEFDDLNFLPVNTKGIELYWCEKDRAILPEWTWKVTIIDVLYEKPIKNMLVVWIVGKDAVQMENLTEDEVEHGCWQMLKHFLKNDQLPQPKQMFRSAWFNNEHVKGSYSFDGIGTKDCDRKKLAKPILHLVSQKPIVMFAGEATHSVHYSTLHGALLSGQREGDRIANSWAEP